MRLFPAAVLLAVAITSALAFACGDGGGPAGSTATGPPALEGSGGVYLALGDSIAEGTGASDAAQTSYVASVGKELRSRYGDELEMRSLAAGDHTTQDLIDQQLPEALTLLRAGDVRVVTITIGGNDLSQYAADAACLPDPSSPECPLEDGLREVEARLDTILADVVEASPDTIAVIQVYPNLFSGTGHQFDQPADTAFRLLNGVIVTVAARYDVLVADPRLDFEGRGGDLSHLLDPTPDAHPNDQGHRAIADAFLEALGLPE